MGDDPPEQGAADAAPTQRDRPEVPPLDELKRICWKAEDAWLSWHIYRPISIRLTRLVGRTRVSANAVTGFGLLAALVGGGLLATGRPALMVAGAAVAQVWVLMDHMDGEVARLRAHQGLPSRPMTGEFWDFVANHLVAHPLLFLFAGVGAFRRWGDVTYLMLGAGATFGTMLSIGVWLTKRKVQFEGLFRRDETGGSEAAKTSPQGRDSAVVRDRGLVDTIGRFFRRAGGFIEASFVVLGAVMLDWLLDPPAVVQDRTSALHLHGALPSVLWFYGVIFVAAAGASAALHLRGRVEAEAERLAAGDGRDDEAP